MSNRNVWCAFSLVSIGGGLFGYIIGITGNTFTTGQLLCPDGYDKSLKGTWTSFGYDQCYELTPLATGILCSLNILGAAVASLSLIKSGDSIGRRDELLIASVLYAVGALIAATSPMLATIGFGYFVYGLGVGATMHAAPCYIAEFAPPKIRGMMLSGKELAVVGGMVFGFLFGFVFSSIDTVGWRFMTALPVILAGIMGMGALWIPESPRWLVLYAVSKSGKGESEESPILDNSDQWMKKARESLEYYRQDQSPTEIEAEMQEIYDSLKSDGKKEKPQRGNVFQYTNQLIVACGLVTLQQVTGQPSVLYFATNIFKQAGFGENAALSAVSIGVLKFLATCVTAYKIDEYGRRKLLFWGITMMSLALAILVVSMGYRECSVPGLPLAQCSESQIRIPQQAAIAVVLALMLYVSGYQVGFGPIAWLMVSEVFPLNIRSSAISIAVTCNFAFNILVTASQVVVETALSPSGLFSAYFGLSIVSIVFVWFWVPETKGKTLEQIEQYFEAQEKQKK